MKKILIITYYWPPSGGAGVQRWLKFTKYLPEYGLEPIVLTVDPAMASYAQTDESLEQEVPGSLRVYRTKTVEFYNLYKHLTGKKEIPYGGFANDGEDSFLQRMARVVRGNLFIPDPRKGWNRYAYRKAAELIRQYRIDLVLTSSPPHSTQLIGLKLKKKLGIRWIADLRDPWTDIYYYRELHHSSLARKVDRDLELAVLRNADRVITVSQDVKRIFAEKLTEGPASKFIVIPNGYDEDDFRQTVELPDGKFVITYTGTISEAYDMTGFLDALSLMNEQQRTEILLRFVGKVPASVIEKIRQKVPDIDLDLGGYVDHQESVRYLLRSSLQLLIIPKVENNKGIVTGKFFEYLASGKPVLAIGPRGGDLDQLMEETGCGKLFEYQDGTGMKNMIEQVMKNEFSQKTVVENTRYSRKELARKLIQELKL